MNQITHKQAIKWIHRRLDGLLSKEQILLLDEHLNSCEACRAYAAGIESLPARLQSEFHARWDEQPGPSQRIMQSVTTKARNIPMTNRISSNVKLFGGIAALLVLGFVINFVVSQLQRSTITATGTQTVNTLPRPEDRLLAFSSDQNGNYDIYTMHADGSGLKNLTNDPAEDGYPFWSPDGKQIAFTSNRGGSTQIYLMNADGSNVTQLTDAGNSYFDGNGPTPWSPDGRKLIFAQQSNGERNYRLYSIDTHGQNKTVLTNEPGRYLSPSWSPDGKHISFYELYGDVKQVSVVDSQGNHLTRLTDALPRGENLIFGNYYWSQDGMSIFLLAETNHSQRTISIVYKASLDGTLTAISTPQRHIIDWWNGTGLQWEETHLTWLRSDESQSTLDLCPKNDSLQGITYKRSENGNLVFASNCSVNGWTFYWANPDGTIKNKLLNSGIPDQSDNILNNMAWSPDDRFLAFVALNTNSPDVVETLYVLDVTQARKDPSIQPLKMAGSYNPAWQPIDLPKLADNSSKLTIDPQSCITASEIDSTLRPPNELYGYKLIQGISLVDGDFSYEFWLYCDPTLTPDEKENLNTIAGLGIFSSWRYNGPKVEGDVKYHYEFEPNIPFGETGLNGPFYKATVAGARFGIDMPPTTVQTYIQQGTPIRFRTIIDSPLGRNGATLSFKLEPTERGVRIADLHAEGERFASATPQSSSTAAKRLLAFASADKSSHPDIYTMHPDGSELKDLTNNPADDRNPFWSPDGRRIAFESNRDGPSQIYLMDADGSNVFQVTSGATKHSFLNSNPWSPDGSRLLFLEQASAGGTWMLYAIGVDGQEKTLLAQGLELYNAASWSPDTRHIAFIVPEQVGDRTMSRIRVVDRQGGNPTDATKLVPADEDLASSYSWSPDGQSLFFIASRVAWDSSAGTSSRYAAYQASLDGKTLTEKAKSSTSMSSWWQGTAFVIGSFPSTLTWLHSDGTYNTFSPLANCPSVENSTVGISADRSANGTLLFGVNCPNDEWWLYWANADGTVVKQLLDAPLSAKGGGIIDTAWSSDDKYVTITVTSSGINYMYVIDIEAALKDASRQPVQVTLHGDVLSSNISWQPLP